MRLRHLTGVWALAFAARVLHVWSVRDTTLFGTLMGDARAYDSWAMRLAGGDWIGTEVFYQAPLYAYFLGAIYALAGHDLLIVRVVQAALGATSAALIASAAARLFSRPVGLAAGVAMALYAPAIFFDGIIQKTSLDVVLVSVIIWLASRIITASRTALWAALGLALGALSLTRENALALVLVSTAWALTHQGTLAVRSRSLMAVLAGLMIVLTPVAVRNYTVGGGVYLTTAQFGPNFYIGNNPEADGTYMSLRPGRGSPEFERADATALAEQATGRELSPAEVSSYWWNRAREFIVSEPVAWTRLMVRKAVLLINVNEMLDTESQESYEDESPLLRVLGIVGHFGLLLPLAAVGLLASSADRRLLPLHLMFGMYAFSVLLFFVFARYRFPLVPYLVIFAAVGAMSAHRLWRQGTPPTRAGGIAALAAMLALIYWPLLSPIRMRAISDTNLGVALHDQGRVEDAVAQYRRAITIQPDYVPAYNNLGVALRAAGRTDEAIAAYREGLRQPGGGLPDLHFNLANALLEQQRTDEAISHLEIALKVLPGSAAAHNNLGMALAERGDHEAAIGHFRAAIHAEPSEAALAHRNLANVLASLGRPDDAITELRRALALNPSDAEALYDLGSVLLEQGRWLEARRQFEAVLVTEPKHTRAMNNLGIAIASQGRVREAATWFERALAVDPRFEDARRNLATARAALRQSG